MASWKSAPFAISVPSLNRVSDPVAPFSPSTIPGLQLWLDANDSATIVLHSGGVDKVEEWQDKSGNNRHATQSASSHMPQYTLEVKNGLNGVAFDDSPGSCLNLPSFNSVPFTIFMVMAYKTTGNTGFALWFNRGGTTPTWRNGGGINPPDYQSIGVDYGGPMLRYVADPAVDDNFFHIQTLSLPDSNFVGAFYLDGDLGNSSQAFGLSSGSCTGITLGAYNQIPDNSSLVGTICEVIWYDSELGTTDRDAVTNYLSAKWDIAVAS